MHQTDLADRVRDLVSSLLHMYVRPKQRQLGGMLVAPTPTWLSNRSVRQRAHLDRLVVCWASAAGCDMRSVEDRSRATKVAAVEAD